MAPDKLPTEHQEQVAVVQRFNWTYPQHYGYLFAIPNGGLRNKRVAIQLRNEGVVPGIPDLFLAMVRNFRGQQRPGLFIEMKRRQRSKTSQDQLDRHQQLREQGYVVGICRGSDEAWDLLTEYLGHDETGEAR